MSGYQFISIADIEAALNATFDAAKQTYKVFGLDVGLASITAHVAFANRYISNILGSGISTTDSIYQSAELAALDLACIRILVTCSGGSLIGAFDYFIGDMRIARAGAFATALKASLDGYADDLARQMVNLTPVAKLVSPSAEGEVPTYKGGLMGP
jgi:hypothetical protein